VVAIAAAAPGAPLILDGNCGFSADKALQLTATLLEQGVQVALLEQPVPKDDWDGLHQVAQWGGIPVAAAAPLTRTRRCGSSRSARRRW
jgi:L-Ala-D/L-Glu epimerase